MTNFSKIEDAIQDLKDGKMIIVVDDENRENEGDLLIAAEFADANAINFMAKNGRGLICLTLTGKQLDKLKIPMMVENNSSPFETGFTVSIEAAKGTTTGISAEDRAKTIKAAISLNAKPEDVVSPGHIFPLRAREAGVLERAGHTEAGVDLPNMAGLLPASVICEIMNDDGTMSRLPQLKEFAKQHGLKIISIDHLIKERLKEKPLVSIEAEAKLPIDNIGEFKLTIFRHNITNEECCVLEAENMKFDSPPLVRIHSSCFTGDALGSLRCDCGPQLKKSLKEIYDHGGHLIYLQQEGRGIGLIEKIKAYTLQEQGFNTIEANEKLGFDGDQRNYMMAVQVLNYLGIKKIDLLTNNPLKIDYLEEFGIQVRNRVPIEIAPNRYNKDYLRVKKHEMFHKLNQI